MALPAILAILAGRQERRAPARPAAAGHRLAVVGAGVRRARRDRLPLRRVELQRPQLSRGSRSVDGPLVVDAGLLLAGEPLDRGHDLVGGLAAGPPGRHALEATAEVDRLTERDGDRDDPRPGGADRLDVLGAGQARRVRRGRRRSAPGGRRRCGRGRGGRRGTGCPRGRCRTPRPRASTSRAMSRLAIAALVSSRSTGSMPSPSNQTRVTPSRFSAGAGEVVGLGQEDHLARHHARDHDRVHEAQVVAGQDHAAGPRHVLEAAHRRPPDRLEGRWQHAGASRRRARVPSLVATPR